MTLTPGIHLGPYEILSPLGAGGMGEVYKARDTRLDRFVAVKVLPEHLATNAEALARFEREAKAVAALNHPNITGIFDLGAVDGTAYVAMELLEGESLRTRLEQGPLPPRLATELAIQMTHGLAAAHEKGVVHRDLKPDNLWLTKEGRLKILDFGLAKQLPGPGQNSDSYLATAAISPKHHTEQGMILGTLGYMSPEQVRGEAVDARADLFSFGVVLFEMLTGKRAFARDTASDTMAAILRDDPPEVEGASRPIPLALRRIIDHCLEKAPARRFRDAHDVAFALENLSGSSEVSAPFTAPFAPQNRRATWLWAALTGLLLAGAAVAGWGFRRDAPAPVRRWDLVAGNLGSRPVTNLVLSRNGDRLVYVMDHRLWVRDLAEGQAREVAGSDQADAFCFWSPDGGTLVFSARGKVWRTALGGDPPLAICDIPGNVHLMGGAWLRNGDLLLSAWRGDLYRVPSSGGEPKVAVALDHAKDVDFHQLHVLPDGESVLSVLHSVKGEHDIVQIKGGTQTVVLHDERASFWVATYVEPGFLLMSRQDNEWTESALWAAPYSPAKAKLTGPAFLVAPELDHFSSHPGGLLAYLPSPPRQLEPVWLDEGGKVVATAGPAMQEAMDPALSPDGRRALVAANTGHGRDIWMLDLGGRTWSPVTDAKAGSQYPRWSPDGREIAFELRTADSWFPSVTLVPDDGSARFRKLAQGVCPLVTPDGKAVVFALDQAGQMDIMRAPREGGAPSPLLATPNAEFPLAFSPDGNWLLYASNESGRTIAYVMRYPGGGEKKALAIGPTGAYLPIGIRTRQLCWTSKGRIYFWDGKSLGYLDADIRKGLVPGPSRILFQDPGQGIAFARGFDVDPRTGRILVLRDVAGPSLDSHVIRVIENVGTLLAQRSGSR